MQGMLRKLSSCQTTVTFEILVTLACGLRVGTHKLESRRGREDPKRPCMTRKGVSFWNEPDPRANLSGGFSQPTRVPAAGQAGPGQSHRPPQDP